jgi:hypothetical protein
MGIYDQVILWLSVVLALAAVFVCAYKSSFLRYFWLNLFLLSGIAFTLGCYYVQSVFGYDSDQYFYFYYTGDAVFNILGYVLIGTFFDRLLRPSSFHQYVRPTLVFTFLLILAISGRFVWQSVYRFESQFVYEFQQNIYFVGVLLTFLLWISLSFLSAQNTRFVLLVSGLGIYYSIHAGNYALQFLAPALREYVYRVPPLAYVLMVGLWLYAFIRVPEAEPVVVTASEKEFRESEAFVSARTQ